LHWASAHGQAEVINYLIFNGATLNLKSKDGMTPLHLAAQKHKLNSAHLLVEAGADRTAVNEARQKPIDLCGNNPPMCAILREPKTLEDTETAATESIAAGVQGERGEVVLAAAKDLLNSTLVPVTAYEETIVLACQKVADEATNVQKAPNDEYGEIQKALFAHNSILDEFKAVVGQVQNYRSQLGLNRRNVTNMGDTLAESQREVTSKLQMKRTANVQTRSHLSRLADHLNELREEHTAVSTELDELEARVAALRARKAQLETDIEQGEEENERMSTTERRESTNENLIAIHQESIQATRALIEKGDTRLTNLQDSTAQRLLKTGSDFAAFLSKYMEFVKELLEQFDYKVRTMNERITDENRNYSEISKLHLKMDPAKFTALIDEYRANLARFERRRAKVLVIADTIRREYASLTSVVGEFGRELPPME
jgi:DNA repair exonuclease SbcCD ATPase subunit